MPKITPETQALATQWVRDLRSGKYKQGRSVLVADSKFCCLGVFAEGIKELDEGRTPGGRLNQLDPAQLKKLGMTDAEQSLLIALNDGEDEIKISSGNRSRTSVNAFLELNFYQIANIIEAWYDLD